MEMIEETTPTLWFLYDWRIWAAVVIIVIICATLYAYRAWSNKNVSSERVHVGDEPVKQHDFKEKEKGKETWCLVAEDLAGRYCIKVPGPQSCTKERSYLSLDQCTLTPAMHLPARTL